MEPNLAGKKIFRLTEWSLGRGDSDLISHGERSVGELKGENNLSLIIFSRTSNRNAKIFAVFRHNDMLIHIIQIKDPGFEVLQIEKIIKVIFLHNSHFLCQVNKAGSCGPLVILITLSDSCKYFF